MVAVGRIMHPEMDAGTTGDTSVWDELRLARFCEELDKASAPDVLAMAKTLARAVMVTHPAAMRLMIRETIRASTGYSEAQTAALVASVMATTKKPSGWRAVLVAVFTRLRALRRRLPCRLPARPGWWAAGR